MQQRSVRDQASLLRYWADWIAVSESANVQSVELVRISSGVSGCRIPDSVLRLLFGRFLVKAAAKY